jgi:DNA (cytosine-5)-methyltransferase 1
MRKLRVLDLFSGIGGFSLGLERTGGFETAAFCEYAEFPRKVLAKHWPGVPIYTDVCELTAERLHADGISGIDVIIGGFPCQDISQAGHQRGIGEGTRSGLYKHVIRLYCELRPSYIILENVSALLSGPSKRPGGWFGRILSDLAELGLDAEWENIPAWHVGLPHNRQRVWIVAYPAEIRHAGEILGWHYPKSDEARETGASLLPPYFDGLGEAPDSYSLREGDGFSSFMGVLNALGNAVVPQIPEMIGCAILKSLKEAA